jgi:hypothetical protein
MLEPKKAITHIGYAQQYEAGKFRRWLETAEASVETDAEGRTTVHVFENRILRGASGYTCFVPVGTKPPFPPPPKEKAQRPGAQQSADDEEI